MHLLNLLELLPCLQHLTKLIWFCLNYYWCFGINVSFVLLDLRDGHSSHPVSLNYKLVSQTSFSFLCSGHKKICLTFCILHLLVGIWKGITSHPNIWLASICLGLANSIFYFSFETWMVVEHDKVCELFIF